jgi:ribose 5-phosphate isomerase B
MRIALGSDHYGLPLKKFLVEHLRERGYEITDFGTHTMEPVDYPDIAEKVAEAVAAGQYDRGILVCGTSIGMAICANKVPGIRAAQVHDAYSAERAAKSNDAQIITMGSEVIGPGLAKVLVDIWLASEFAGGRSAPKVEKIRKLDEKYRRPVQ